MPQNIPWPNAQIFLPTISVPKLVQFEQQARKDDFLKTVIKGPTVKHFYFKKSIFTGNTLLGPTFRVSPLMKQMKGPPPFHEVN